MAKATQGKILKSAEELFWYQGHKGTSLDEIAKKAGQSKGAVFHYFSNKAEITKLVLQHYAAEELFAPLVAHFAKSNDVKAALKGWVRDIYERFSAQDYKGGCMLGNLALELSDKDEEIRVTLSALFLEWENQMVRLLRAHAKTGQMVMEERQFARLIIATLQGLSMTSKVHKDKNRAGREFQVLDELIEGFII